MTSFKQRLVTSSFKTFSVVWSGQLISFIGSGLTSFALGVWVYQKTDSITLFALISLFAVLPSTILGPIAGPLIDRWDRRLIMLVSDIGGALSILFIIILLASSQLEIWHIFLSVFVSGICDMFRWPALTAATTQLIPKEHFGRANGLLQIVQVGQFLISPLLAGSLIGTIGLTGILSIDFITYLFATLTLLLIRIPRPTITTDGLASKGSLWHEAAYGWAYIRSRPGLLALVKLFAISNFTTEMSFVLFTPLILSFATALDLGTATSLGSLGYLVGSIVMTVWGGTKRRIKTVVGSMLLLGLFMALIGVRASIELIILSVFMTSFWVPIVTSSNQTIWQSKVAPDIQGRVFAIRRAIVLGTTLLCYVVAGPLADNIFEPLLAVHGPLASSVGQIIGVGAGRGIGLLLMSMGVILMIVTGLSYLSPRLRYVEDELPDMVSEEPVLTLASSSVVGAATD